MGWWERRAAASQRRAERQNELFGGDDWVERLDRSQGTVGRAVGAYLAVRTVILAVVLLALAVVGLVAFVRSGM